MVHRIAPSSTNTIAQRRTIQDESGADSSASVQAEALQAAQTAGAEVINESSLERGNKLLKQTYRVGNAFSALQGDSAAKARRISNKVGGAAGTARVGVINAQAGMDIARAIQTGNSQDVKQAAKSTVTAAVHDAGLAAEAVVTRAPQRLGRAASQGKAGLGLLGIPSSALRAAHDVNRAVSTGNSSDIANAAESVGGAATTAAQAATDGAAAASKAVQYSASKKAAAAAIRAADPSVTKAAASAASKAIAETVAEKAAAGASSRVISRAASAAGSEVVSNPAVMRAAGAAAAKTAGNATVKTLGRAAARFAPGVNVAIATYDTAVMAKDLADPNASMTRKIASVVTAAGSGAAATNIPVVSQVGAGVALVSGMVREFF